MKKGKGREEKGQRREDGKGMDGKEGRYRMGDNSLQHLLRNSKSTCDLHHLHIIINNKYNNKIFIHTN